MCGMAPVLVGGHPEVWEGCRIAGMSPMLTYNSSKTELSETFLLLELNPGNT